MTDPITSAARTERGRLSEVVALFLKLGFTAFGGPGLSDRVIAAVLATIGIFLPSFVFVALSHPLIPRLRQSPWTGALLDGVNVASLGLMAAVTWQLGVAALVDPLTVVLALVAAILLLRFRVNSTWLVLGGAAIGLVSVRFLK
jgi:chromate transporter